MVLEGFDASGKPKLRPAKRAITLRHLADAHLGFTYSKLERSRSRNTKRSPAWSTLPRCKNGAFASPLEFDPGERWQYGIGMDVVGKIVEAVSDQSLEIYFGSTSSEPLGMANTGFLISSAQKQRAATTYARQADGSLKALPFEMPQRPEFFSGGGGLFGTPRDYMAFLQMLLGDGTFNGAQILKPQTVAAMRTNQIGDLDVNPLKSSAPVWSNDANLFPACNRSGVCPSTSIRSPGPTAAAPAAAPGRGFSTATTGSTPSRK